MTRNTLSPAPWAVRRLGDDWLVVDADGNVLGTVCEADDGDNTEPDACLMATAPELLAAVNALFEHCAMIHKHWGDGSNATQAQAAIAAARAAVAKAERRAA